MEYDRLHWVREQCSPEDSIADIGCNKGHTFREWRNRDNVIHIDIDLYALPNFIQADAAKLPLEDNSVDVAILSEILEHVEDPVACLKEAMRIATRKVVITVPNEHEWEEEALPFDTIEKQEERTGKSREELAKATAPALVHHTSDNYEHIWHVRHYTEETFKKDLEKAGYGSYKLSTLKNGPFVWFCAVETL